jgi:D-glycero-alpha-D-manno-heptose-7-phosphate kinase
VIIIRTPVRVSFLGGGTDYPDHFRLHGGRTLGVAIDKYSFITVSRLAPLFEYSIRVTYSRAELTHSVNEIQHPAVRECMRFLGIEGGIEIHYVGDLPARTGLGSSSSFTVALLHALHAFKGDHVGHDQLADEACHVEHQMIHERVGVQDQYTCAHGGLLQLEIGTDGRVSVGRMPLSSERLAALGAHLMLFYTGVRRNAHEILDEQLERTRRGELAAALLRMEQLAVQGVAVLTADSSLLPFGELLHDAWQVKRSLSSRITNDLVDGAYGRARAAGVIGGKLLGAGGGGFLLLFVEPERHAEVARALPELRQVEFGFDHEGSRILFCKPE